MDFDRADLFFLANQIDAKATGEMGKGGRLYSEV